MAFATGFSVGMTACATVTNCRFAPSIVGTQLRLADIADVFALLKCDKRSKHLNQAAEVVAVSVVEHL